MEEKTLSDSELLSKSELVPSVEPIIKLLPKKRYLSIDVFRGLVMATMVFVNSVNDFSTMPWWSRHAVNWGLTYVDLVEPCFIFAIGLTYHMNYVSERKKNGGLQANLRFLKRFCAFAGLGFLGWTVINMIIGGGWQINANGVMVPHYEWDTLQSIGMAGVVALFFINLPRIWRLIAGLTTWVVYQWCWITFNLGTINLNEVNSGYFGGIGYGVLLILATAITESFQTGKMKDFLIAGVSFTIAGLITGYFWGISKNELTGPYVLICLGLACLVFYVVWYLYDDLQITKNSSKFFQPMGKNPLMLYIIHGLVTQDTCALLMYYNPLTPWYWLTLIGLINILIIWRIGVWMDRRGTYISF